MSRPSSPLVFGLVAVLASAGPARAATSSLTFTVPPGWVDLSPGSDRTGLDGVPPAMLEMARNGSFTFFAADIAGGGDGFIENANLVPTEKSSRVTEELVSSVADHVSKQLLDSGATSSTPIEHGVVDFGGVHVGRIVTDSELSGVRMRQVGYVIPGRDRGGVLTCSAARDKWDEYLPTFEALARSVQGAEEPPSRWSRVGRGALNGAVIGGIIGLVLALAKKLKR